MEHVMRTLKSGPVLGPASDPSESPHRFGTVHSLSALRDERVVPPSVLAAIELINRRYDEPLTMSRLAAEVYVSPFHFCRIFARATGITPGRYLTAVRLFEAKRLLLTSELTVSDIVCTVGYSSVGTFTTRFTAATGMSPSQYRDPRVRDLLLAIAPHFRRLPAPQALREAGAGGEGAAAPGGAHLSVRMEIPAGLRPADVVVGVFGDAVPQRGPVAFQGIQDTGPVTLALDSVPPGRWHVIAAAEHRGPGGEAEMSFGALRSPVWMGAGEEVPIRLRIRALRPTDPPIAITFAGGAHRPFGPAAAGRRSAA
jgi:AraC family transcriptional regulator